MDYYSTHLLNIWIIWTCLNKHMENNHIPSDSTPFPHDTRWIRRGWNPGGETWEDVEAKRCGDARWAHDTVTLWQKELQYILLLYIYIHIYIYIWATAKKPAILNMYWTDIGVWKLMKIVKTHGKQWDLPKLAIPPFEVMSLYFSNIHISDTQIGRRFLWIIYMYIYI